ncbi:MAG: Hsp70 family protein [Actinomycetia bacterium]|nr:Hsp70 family protein [Actinomycetes bacterium]
MTYWLGVDLGTTYTAAATYSKGRSEIFDLGTRAPSVPSVVYVREDGTLLTGAAASRRALQDPSRVAREFKRRVGDPTPILLAGSPYPAEVLSAKLLRSVIDAVATRQRSAPAGVVLTHPANWGPYKLDLITQALRVAEIDDVELMTEPEAAAIQYASLERVDPGSVVAVFDLGGGTFDAAVLRKDDDQGFEFLGRPEGIERLGGVDFDEAVFGYVSRWTGDALQELDPTDLAVLAAVARLRSECVEAKEALSFDTKVTIPVVLPNVLTEVTLTRSEFEDLIRPSLDNAVAAMRRVIKGANIELDDVDLILLVGGSSRIPLIGEMVAGGLGRPVAVDAHPKHLVAMGAALAASIVGESEMAAAMVAPPTVVQDPPAEPVIEPSADVAVVTPPVEPVADTVVTPPVEPLVEVAAEVPEAPAAPVREPRSEPVAPSNDEEGRKRGALIIGATAVALMVGVGAFLLRPDGGETVETGDAVPSTSTDFQTTDSSTSAGLQSDSSAAPQEAGSVSTISQEDDMNVPETPASSATADTMPDNTTTAAPTTTSGGNATPVTAAVRSTIATTTPTTTTTAPTTTTTGATTTTTRATTTTTRATTTTTRATTTTTRATTTTSTTKPACPASSWNGNSYGGSAVNTSKGLSGSFTASITSVNTDTCRIGMYITWSNGLNGAGSVGGAVSETGAASLGGTFYWKDEEYTLYVALQMSSSSVTGNYSIGQKGDGPTKAVGSGTLS